MNTKGYIIHLERLQDTEWERVFEEVLNCIQSIEYNYVCSDVFIVYSDNNKNILFYIEYVDYQCECTYYETITYNLEQQCITSGTMDRYVQHCILSNNITVFEDYIKAYHDLWKRYYDILQEIIID